MNFEGQNRKLSMRIEGKFLEFLEATLETHRKG